MCGKVGEPEGVVEVEVEKVDPPPLALLVQALRGEPYQFW